MRLAAGFRERALAAAPSAAFASERGSSWITSPLHRGSHARQATRSMRPTWPDARRSRWRPRAQR
eukprot:12082190-Alexandrium_andersonii.AAC.1